MSRTRQNQLDVLDVMDDLDGSREPKRTPEPRLLVRRFQVRFLAGASPNPRYGAVSSFKRSPRSAGGLPLGHPCAPPAGLWVVAPEQITVLVRAAESEQDAAIYPTAASPASAAASSVPCGGATSTSPPSASG